MVRPVQVSVKSEDLHRPTVSELPALRPAPVSRVGGLRTSFETMGRLRDAGFLLSHSARGPDRGSTYLIAMCGFLALGCLLLRQVRFSCFSESFLWFCISRLVFLGKD